MDRRIMARIRDLYTGPEPEIPEDIYDHQAFLRGWDAALDAIDDIVWDELMRTPLKLHKMVLLSSMA